MAANNLRGRLDYGDARADAIAKVEKRCFGITPATQNRMTGELAFIREPSHPRAHGAKNQSMEAWCRCYTILANYASGKNDVMERWLPLPALLKLHREIFGEEIQLSEWNARNYSEFAEALQPVCSSWKESNGTVYVKLIDEQREFSVKYLCAFEEWRLAPLSSETGYLNWKCSVELLAAYYGQRHCDPNYLRVRMEEFFKDYPTTATMDWVIKVRSRMYALLTTYHPLGVVADDVIGSYRTLYGDNLSACLGGRLTISILLGQIVDDMVRIVRESQYHSMVFVKFCQDVEFPAMIKATRRIQFRQNETTVRGTIVSECRH